MRGFIDVPILIKNTHNLVYKIIFVFISTNE